MNSLAGTFSRKIPISYHRVYVSGGRLIFAAFFSFLPIFRFEKIQNPVPPIKVKAITDTTSKFISSPLRINYCNFVQLKVQV